MEMGRPSQTAFIMAALRARHYMSLEEPRVLDDNLALSLIGLSSLDDIEFIVSRFEDNLAKFGERGQVKDRINAMTMGTCSRSRLVEDRLLAATARGMKQLIILGAGLDTTAYRCQHITSGLEVFEIDYPATQAWKRERLAKAGIAIPENLTFLPCDFENQTLAEAMAAGGVRQDRMSFFAWLGVQPYLTEASVLSTLDTVATFPSGSELVMDLLTALEEKECGDVRKGSDVLLASIGEPWRSCYQPDAFARILRERGYAVVDIVSFPDWLRRHSARFNDRFSAHPTSFVLVTAEKI